MTWKIEKVTEQDQRHVTIGIGCTGSEDCNSEPLSLKYRRPTQSLSSPLPSPSSSLSSGRVGFPKGTIDMTFSILRALHTIIGEALDDIERVYAAEGINVPPPTESSLQPPPDAANRMKFPYASPPPSPSIATPPTGMPHVDFPALDTAYDPNSLSEKLTSHPEVVVAINRIVAASGQLSATVQTPFLSLCDASMAYHLPSCMRLLEASHTIEILRAAGVSGLHVKDISAQNGVEKSKLAHVLRLLATHHISGK
ncbi:hypothetical protein BD779DRAFT_1072572 [Infundibulicybe gibba]|nr:hypothetical protein BD779DRAFT_1072572 [Infundibulicybe gibba]